MSGRAKAKGLYQRGPYWLDWDRRKDGELRSPYLTIFWYDAGCGRTRSTSTGARDVAKGKAALDRHYLTHTEGQDICPTCGQRRAGGSGYLLLQSISDYLIMKSDGDTAIAHRLAHITDFIAERGDLTLLCERVTEDWVKQFREWLAKRPIVSKTGITRDRALSTIENSVIQLAAAINLSHSRGDTSRPAQFKPIPTKDINRTPQHRSDLRPPHPTQLPISRWQDGSAGEDRACAIRSCIACSSCVLISSRVGRGNRTAHCGLRSVSLSRRYQLCFRDRRPALAVIARRRWPRTPSRMYQQFSGVRECRMQPARRASGSVSSFASAFFAS